MRKIVRVIFVAWLVLLTPVWAQSAPQIDAMEARLVSYESVFELVRLVNALVLLDDLAASESQASAMLVLLEPLTAKDQLSPKEARATSEALTSLFTPSQTRWWLALRQAQERQAQRRMAQIRAVGKPTVYTFILPGYPLMQRTVLEGRPFNPFHLEPNIETLAALLERLAAK
jgi:hypothetical protein